MRYEPEQAIATLPALLAEHGRPRAAADAARQAAGRRARARRAADARAAGDARSASAQCSSAPQRRRAPASRRAARRGRRARAASHVDERRRHGTQDTRSIERLIDALQDAARRCPRRSRIPATRARCSGAVEAAQDRADRADPGRARARASRRVAKATVSTSRRIEIVDAPHSQASAAAAVALVREGKAEALMKGSLHTDELMGAVVTRDTGPAHRRGASATASSWTCRPTPSR